MAFKSVRTLNFNVFFITKRYPSIYYALFLSLYLQHGKILVAKEISYMPQ